jgi:RNA polymerase sigma factor (sigma-70 family)
MSPWSADEGRLVEAAARGDGDAFRALTDPLRAELRARCLRILGNASDADDAVQETLLRAWTRLTTVRSSTTVRGWLHVIAANTSLNMVKQGRRRSTAPIDSVPEPAGPGADEEAYEGFQLQDALGVAVDRLPPRQRAALLLREGLGWTPPEIAELLGESTAAVNSALQRARATLADSAGGRARAGDDELRAAVLHRYLGAWRSTDIERVVWLARADARRTPLIERLSPQGGGWVRLGDSDGPEFRPWFMRPDRD